MINKIVPRKLNQSSDSKIRGKDDMFDALNVSISDDTRADVAGNTGSLGVLKPIKSNRAINDNAAFEGSEDKTVLGKITDEKNDVIYFFVYCTDQSQSGVYAYDPSNYFPNHPPQQIIRIYSTEEFAFTPDSFVKADITYIQTKQEYAGIVYEDTPFLFFTDNVNEPRKLNVLRAIFDPAVILYQSGTAAVKDFITACPKAPSFPITFEFVADETLNHSDFRNINGFQFAYQMVYKDQNISAMSTISDIAVPPPYITHGASEQQIPLNQFNVCRLTVPLTDLSVEVDKVKVLARRGNDGQFFEIAELDNPLSLAFGGFEENVEDIIDELTGLTGGELVYDFKNDTVNKIVSTDDQSKHFDQLPKRSEAQAIVNNRLFYGNYVEGFDDVETDAVITPIPHERTPDFTSYDLNVLPATCLSEATIDEFENPNNGYPFTADHTHNKNSAFVLDPSDIPQQGINAGDEINFSFSISPKQNWHVFDATNGFTGGRQLGDFFGFETLEEWLETPTPTSDDNPDTEQDYDIFFNNWDIDGPNNEGVPNPFSDANFPQEGFRVIGDDGVQGTGEISGTGGGDADTEAGLGEGIDINPAAWQDQLGNTESVVYGTSAANPLIIKGGEINISIKIKANQPVTRTEISDYITFLITGDDLIDGLSEGAFEVIENQINNSYFFDLGLQNQQTFSMTSDLGKLITMCGLNLSSNPDTANTNMKGCFILERANVEFGFFKDKAYNQPLDLSTDRIRGEGAGWDSDGEAYKRRIGVYIKNLTSTSTKTCIRNPILNSPWIVLDSNLNVNNAVEGLDLFSDELKGPFAKEGNFTTGFGQGSSSTNQDIIIENAFAAGGIFNTFIGRLQGTVYSGGETAQELSRFSCVDGAGGPAGGPVSFDFTAGYDSRVVFLAAPQLTNILSINGTPNLGTASMFNDDDSYVGTGGGLLFGCEVAGPIINNWATTGLMLPTFTGNPSFPSGALGAGDTSDDPEFDPTHFPIYFAHDVAEILNQTFFIIFENDGGFRSFKSGANHAFGVVYYDQRGRASNVNSLGSVLAPAYHARPDNLYGKISMEVQMNHDAPDFADAFQIVYSGNTSISDFVQYSTGGAFTAFDDFDAENGNIYVSLNYLQGTDISYVTAGGHRSPEGGRDLYTFKEGDVLRVISHYVNDDVENGRVFLSEQYQFEVVDYVELGTDNNPLYDPNSDNDVNGIPHRAKQGSFVVLKNNPDATGFNFFNVKAGGNEINSQTHKWNQRTIIEIFSPKNVAEEEELFFYETSDVFPINEHNLPIELNNGDVWWRKVPVNMSGYSGSGIFLSLIGNPSSVGGSGQESNFKSYSLETKAFNDTVRRADVTGKGKIKVIVPNQQEVRRTASITFSDKNNPASSLFTITSFNPVKAQFKDLPAEHGSINYLVDQQDSLFVIQTEKCASVPVSRNIIATASNDQSLVTASEVLGTIRHYAGKNGCDNNPESVCSISNAVYFANKSYREVYKFNPASGIEVISDKGMRSFFRDMFRQVEAEGGVIKVVGGYDPIKDEYVLSVYNQPEIQFTGVDSTGASAGGGGIFVQDTTTINSLEQQLFNVMSSMIGLTTPAGDVFNVTGFPVPLQLFYNNFSGTNQLDYLNGLDADGNSLFTLDEVVSTESISEGLQQQISSYIDLIENNAITEIITTITDTIDDPDVDTVQEINTYISNLQTDNSNLQTQLNLSNSNFESLLSQYNILVTDYNNLVNQSALDSEIIFNLNVQIEDYLSQIQQLSDQAVIDTNQIASLEAEILAIEQEVSNIAGQNFTNALEGIQFINNSIIGGLQADLDAAQFSIGLLESSIAQINLDHEQEIADLQAQHAVEINNLNDQVVGLQNEISAITAAFNDQIEQINQDNEAFVNQLNESHASEIAALQAEINQLNSDILDLNATILSQAGQLQVADALLQQVIEVNNAAAAALQQENSDLILTRTALNTEIANLRTYLLDIATALFSSGYLPEARLSLLGGLTGEVSEVTEDNISSAITLDVGIVNALDTPASNTAGLSDIVYNVGLAVNHLQGLQQVLSGDGTIESGGADGIEVWLQDGSIPSGLQGPYNGYGVTLTKTIFEADGLGGILGAQALRNLIENVFNNGASFVNAVGQSLDVPFLVDNLIPQTLQDLIVELNASDPEEVVTAQTLEQVLLTDGISEVQFTNLLAALQVANAARYQILRANYTYDDFYNYLDYSAQSSLNTELFGSYGVPFSGADSLEGPINLSNEGVQVDISTNPFDSE